MVGLDQFRDYMKRQAVEDRQRQFVQVSGESLEEALRQASIELGLPVKRLEYEVVEKGAAGTFGIGKKPWKIMAYKTFVEEESAFSSFDSLDGAGFGSGETADVNGEVIVRITPDSVLLKVTPPVGKGRKATERHAIDVLVSRGIGRYDEGTVAKVVKLARGDFIKIADHDHNPAHDAAMSIDIADFEQKCYLTATPPGYGGADLNANAIFQMLRSSGIVFGIKDEVIQGLEEKPVYNQKVLVAEGEKQQDGREARIVYNFDVGQNKTRLKEVDGKVDFKDLNLVQNVVEGQILAKKIPAQQGKPGQTVSGKILPAKMGKDIDLEAGKNVRITPDGLTAIAETSGQVLLVGGKVQVEPVYVITGDVNLRTGNIEFFGTVLVKGSVEDGFNVKASGNVEVMGNVGKCVIDAEGDVIVHQGIAGKSSGVVRAGKSVYSKFIENSEVTAGNEVIVSDGIINSIVKAKYRIMCKGKRATIVGGRLNASQQISAKNLGSVAGAETLLEVGYDPEKKAELEAYLSEKQTREKELEDITLDVATLQNLKKIKKEFPAEKEKQLVALNKKMAETQHRIKELESQSQEVQEYLNSLKTIGKVSASNKVFPGVRISIKDAELTIRSEYRATTFYVEMGMVKLTRYEEEEEDEDKR